jgi:hypothetical protein
VRSPSTSGRATATLAGVTRWSHSDESLGVRKRHLDQNRKLAPDPGRPVRSWRDTSSPPGPPRSNDWP